MGNTLSSAPQAAGAPGAQQDLPALLAAELPQVRFRRLLGRGKLLKSVQAARKSAEASVPAGAVKSAEASSAGLRAPLPTSGRPASAAMPQAAGTIVVGVVATTPPSVPPRSSMARVTPTATAAARAPESSAAAATEDGSAEAAADMAEHSKDVALPTQLFVSKLNRQCLVHLHSH